MGNSARKGQSFLHALKKSLKLLEKEHFRNLQSFYTFCKQAAYLDNGFFHCPQIHNCRYKHFFLHFVDMLHECGKLHRHQEWICSQLL